METIINAADVHLLEDHHSTVSAEITGDTVSVVQVIPGQGIQVMGSDGDNTVSADEDSESKKRRELLARRPSYRRILNDLSATDQPGTLTVAKIEEESDENLSETEEGIAHVGGMPIQAGLMQSALKMLPAQTIQIASQGDGSGPGLQTLTMTNSGSNAVSPSPGGATLVQYAQAADGQFLIPVSTIGGGSIQYQIAGTAGSLPQGVVMATAGGSLSSGFQVGDEQSRKRELRLLKNSDAARECRRKKKEYVKCLENRVAVLENQNKTLIQELKSLKELYCQNEAQS